MSSLHQLLLSHPVNDIPKGKDHIIEIDSHTHLKAAFAALVDNGILSAPVWDATAHKYIGFLDVRDLVSFAVLVSNETPNPTQGLNELVDHGTKLYSRAQEGVTLTYLARRNPIRPVQSGTTLFDVCKLLASGSRRVPVVDESGKIVNIVSQSSVVSFLAAHALQDEFFLKTVGEMKLGSSPVLSVTEQDTALTTFTQLDKTGRSGIAVVDVQGVLIGNTSSSDIKLYLKQHESLHQPITEFLHKIRRLDLTTRAPVFAVTLDDPIHKIIGKLAATKSHRVFVVDEEFHPLRVASLTDIMRLVIKA